MSTQGWSGPSGFTLLLWSVDTPPEYSEKKDILLDAISLLSGRWGLEFEFVTKNNELYAYATCSRFSVAERTVERALGDLFPAYIIFHKGPVTATVDSLVRFQQCKQKWNVADVLSPESDDSRGRETTLFWKKRKTFN
nr:hypothetical non-structural protein [Chaphamaparvovirus carnivoran1]